MGDVMSKLLAAGRDLDKLLYFVAEQIGAECKTDGALRATWAAMEAIKLGLRDSKMLLPGEHDEWAVYVSTNYSINGRRVNLDGAYEYHLTVQFDDGC